MFSPDGTLISASAAPNCGVASWKDGRIGKEVFKVSVAPGNKKAIDADGHMDRARPGRDQIQVLETCS